VRSSCTFGSTRLDGGQHVRRYLVGVLSVLRQEAHHDVLRRAEGLHRSVGEPGGLNGTAYFFNVGTWGNFSSRHDAAREIDAEVQATDREGRERRLDQDRRHDVPATSRSHEGIFGFRGKIPCQYPPPIDSRSILRRRPQTR
jgi:hypothetical protein